MTQIFRLYFLFLVLGATTALNPAMAGSNSGIIAGPVAAELIRVIDGDTLLVNARPWPQQTMEIYVRIRGIDAPEIHAKCESVRQAAQRASRQLQMLTGGSAQLLLTHISGDKYFGRVLADVTLPDGTDAGQALLNAKLVMPYQGRKKAKPFCERLF